MVKGHIVKKKRKEVFQKGRKFSSLKKQVTDIDEDIVARRPIAVRSVRDGQRLLRRLFLARQRGEIGSEYVADMCKLLDRLILLGKELEFNDELRALQEEIERVKNANSGTETMAEPAETTADTAESYETG